MNENTGHKTREAKTEALFIHGILIQSLVNQTTAPFFERSGAVTRKIFCQQFPSNFTQAWYSVRQKAAEASLYRDPYPAENAIELAEALKVVAEEASRICQVSFSSQRDVAVAQISEFQKTPSKESKVLWLTELCQKLKRSKGSPEDLACANKSFNLAFTSWLSRKVGSYEK